MQPEKRSNPLIIVLVVLFLIIIVGFLATKDSSAPADTAKQINDTEEQQKLDSNPATDTEAMNENNTPAPAIPTENTKPEVETDNNEPMGKSEEEPATTPKPPATKPAPTAGSYQDYSAAAVASSNAENIILFFHASWCPSCHALNTNITRNLGSIPAGTEIYKVDYDTSLELRKRYSVTTQHTLVKIDNQGNLQKKWDNSMTLDALVEKI